MPEIQFSIKRGCMKGVFRCTVASETIVLRGKSCISLGPRHVTIRINLPVNLLSYFPLSFFICLRGYIFILNRTRTYKSALECGT